MRRIYAGLQVKESIQKSGKMLFLVREELLIALAI